MRGSMMNSEPFDKLKMKKRSYYLYKFFLELIPVYPVYPILFESEGLTITQISLLLAIWTIPALLFEVPSGVLADRLSRKNLLVIGCLLKGSCFLCWFLSEGFLLFAIGFLLWGIGSTLMSGAEEALLFDTLKRAGEEASFDRVLGRGRFFMGVSLAAACLIGGFLSDHIGMNSVLFFSILSTMIAAGVAVSFPEVNLYRERLLREKKQEKIKQTKKSTLFEGFTFFRKRRNLVLILFMIMVVGFSGILDEYDSLIAEEYSLSLGLIGVWVCVRGLLLAAGGLFAPVLKKVLSRVFSMKKELTVSFLICFSGAVSLFLSGAIRQKFCIAFYGLFYFLFSAGEVLTEDCLQQRIEEEGRSTVHSILSLLLNLYALLSFTVLGVFLKKGTLFNGLMFVAIYLLVLLFTLLWVNRSSKDTFY